MLSVFLISAAIAAPSEIIFDKKRIGDTVYEACSIFDVDNDGHKDIVSGEYWFPGPDFQSQHKICHVKPESGYHDDFGDYPMDVNGDGYLDIVSGAWFGQTLTWRENPKGKSVEWKVHNVAKIGNIERPAFWDIDGDGIVDVAPNTPNGPQRIFKLNSNRGDASPQFFIQHTISPLRTGHGLGFGDLNGDGRGDLIIHNGWFEAPENAFEDEWAWHPDFKLYDSSSVPIIVYDVNGDGRNDIIVGAGHDYGLAWWEQKSPGKEKTNWDMHEIETELSQFHEMALADLDNDGKPELITGKRWRAHNGNDPGGNEPVGLYYYRINNGAFERHTIDFGPADTSSGTGIYLWIEDIDGDGWKDILAAGKEGMYLFSNKGLAD